MRNAFLSVEHHIPPELRQGLAILLSQSADPQATVARLETFCQTHGAEFQLLAYTPFGLQALVGVFGTSAFLSAELQQHPEWLVEALESGRLHRMRQGAEMAAELDDWLAAEPEIDTALRLAAFRRKQILRILLRDVLGFGALAETTEELSHLAGALLDAATARLRAQLEMRHGEARLESGQRAGFSVVALGKLGGLELNYSSDIDLMFVHGGAGRTAGTEPLTNQEFFSRLAHQVTELLGTRTREGLIYRVDLRLRPDGRHGEICLSADATRAYYEARARPWELQMLIKARVAAGDTGPGREFLDWVQPLIYSSSLDFTAVERMSETRARINETMNARAGQRLKAGGADVKLAPGGIRDIEFLVQCLQRLHGGREAWLRNSSTLLALTRLRDKDLLSDAEYSRLVSAYQFMRHLEHRLQVDEDRQTHTLPAAAEALSLVARRMPAALSGEQPTAQTLLATLETHFEHVRTVYQRVIHAQQPSYYAPPAEARPEPPLAQQPSSNLMRFLDQRAPALAAAVARARLGRSQAAFEHFLESVTADAALLEPLNEEPALAGALLDIFAHSPYLAEQLMRRPAGLGQIREMVARGTAAAGFDELLMVDDASEIRRSFQRQMFRIQAESICLQSPVFDTLRLTSALADAAIGACYKLAVGLTLASRPPLGAGYRPSRQMMVIALGRLGMLEFDLGSDADLIFVLPEADMAEHAFWTRVAERLIAIVSSYTGDGAIFSVDHRLCPNGKAGALVQSEPAYREYFARSAEAWEGVAYMKARAVAGDLDRATGFLAELQNIDWRRYGQSGRSRQELRHIRARMERELAPVNPLKSASGGYYDIDFSLMYLRLRGAGLFFKELNTPARIEVLEQMGHLDASDARFLLDAAVFYRAVDHGLRLISGHTEGSLPASEWHAGMLTQLVKRWVPPHLCDQKLATELLQIQERTREFFIRLFDDRH